MAEHISTKRESLSNLQMTAHVPGIWTRELTPGVPWEQFFGTLTEYVNQHNEVPFYGFTNIDTKDFSSCTLFRDLAPTRPNPLPAACTAATNAACQQYGYTQHDVQPTWGFRSIFAVDKLPLEDAAQRAEAHLPQETGAAIMQALIFSVKRYGRQMAGTREKGLVISGPGDRLDTTRRIGRLLRTTHMIEEDMAAGETRKIKLHY